MDQKLIAEVANRLSSARRAVAFTGAGISTESGIPDFRSPGGVWSKYEPVYYDEFLASDQARLRYWRMKKEMYPEFARARPNAGHYALAKLEKARKIVGVITQNIDGLHQEAGSRRVLELHGNARYVHCISCDKRWTSEVIFEQYRDRDQVPTCDRCGGWLKPAVVSFGESLPGDVLQESFRLSTVSDVFLAIGSSLVVEPAASLPAHAKQMGSFLVIINRDATPLDNYADAVIHTPIGTTLEAITKKLGL
ncbi:MAG: Sir2 family NAD-dependent protein deacetylase [Planctomycetota bacterium]|nr:MAG: Sir2 family NAD-dependent protein deacetylase [Planctomycetota bacterium]